MLACVKKKQTFLCLAYTYCICYQAVTQLLSWFSDQLLKYLYYKRSVFTLRCSNYLMASTLWIKLCHRSVTWNVLMGLGVGALGPPLVVHTGGASLEEGSSRARLYGWQPGPASSPSSLFPGSTIEQATASPTCWGKVICHYQAFPALMFRQSMNPNKSSPPWEIYVMYLLTVMSKMINTGCAFVEKYIGYSVWW